MSELTNEFVMEELDARLREAYPNYSGYTCRDGVFEYHGITSEEAAVVFSVVESDADVIVMNTVRNNAISDMAAYIDMYPRLIYGVPSEVITIYERKQLLVNSWSEPGIPTKTQIEWDNDWSLRPEFIANEWVEIEALGVGYKCETANDLWEIWKLKTELGNYLDSMSEPLRTKAQYDTLFADTEGEVDLIVLNFKSDLHALPTSFITDVAPGLIAASGLTPVTQ